MERRKLGKSELTVPVIGMGTWRTFDVRGQAEEAARVEIVRVAYDSGVDFYDSSPMYGEAERVLGAAVDQLGIRDKVQIATKIWTDSDSKSKQQIADSLGYFGGYIDLYQIHNLVAWQKRLEQLEELKAQGKVRALGITHYQHSALGQIALIMKSGRIEEIQIPYNALDRLVEQEILPLAKELNIGVLVMRPLGAGNLVKQYPDSQELAPFEKFGVTTWPQVLLKWVVSDPRISSAIPATSHPERMAENAKAGNPPWFDQDTREQVSRLAQKYNG